jgi:isoleucyl-tRNA synthetase
MTTFKPVETSQEADALEREILKTWEDQNAFQRSVDARDPENAYVFYDGPPFATGLPHYGHFVASTLKDIIPRYWTMRGHRVERRFGWDTHGLPIEMEIEKKLELNGPSSIREFGIAKFNETCRENVLTYTDEWRKTITRLGRWVDFDNDYKTMDPEFMESVWWVFSELWKKGLVYQGYRVMPYSWRLASPLSNFEANLDYRDVIDPAVTVTMPIVGDDEGAKLLVWTTTPWTLPSNLGVAVGVEVDYVRARVDGEVYVVAKALKDKVLGEDAEVLKELKGRELVKLKYEPLFDYFKDHENAFVVMASDHVTTEDGTGLVHMAPAYGEDDFNACRLVGIEPVDPVDEEGNFDARVPDYQGQNVKEADKAIIQELKARGRLFHQATIKHSYPFCWRSGTPLIYKAFPVWFVKVEGLREKMVANNETIHWVPEAVGAKRFGNWLKDARDWAVSRNRFWGTPLPIWVCANKECDHKECIGSAEELATQGEEEVSDLHPHKIDHITWECEKCGAEMYRTPEVFDCWFESGAMPYAQLHFPFENKREFERGFPAQFIAEGLDQTRGWFYTLLVLGTALYNDAPFKNCIVNGMVLAPAYKDAHGKRYAADEVDLKGGKAFKRSDGKALEVSAEKMSKRLKNYPDPMHVLEKYGADALRIYLIDSPVVRAEPLTFEENGVREVVRTVLNPLKNAWSFFVQYANIDGWDPSAARPAVSERSELDQWILSVLQSLIRDVNSEMEGYYLYKVVNPLLGFIDDLTNWYIRRSRRRFWRSADDAEGEQDKAAAYATLYEVLVTFSQVVAPLAPFISETLYQNLVVDPGLAAEGHESVHLCDYPMVDEALIHEEMEQAMVEVRAAVRMGRALREKHKLKTRQPLRAVTVVTHDEGALKRLRDHAALIADELNVKDVVVQSDDGALATLTIKPNYKTLGKRMGKNMKACAATVSAWTRAEFEKLEAGGSIEVEGEALTLEDVLVTRAAKEGVVLESEGPLTVALDTDLDDSLKQEGLMREALSKLQKLRKDAGLEVTDRITLRLAAEGELRAALEAHRAHVAAELLAEELTFDEVDAEPVDVEGHALKATVEKR